LNYCSRRPREQHQELRAILGRLRGISYALYIILGILAGASMIWFASSGDC
jgi:hypothetical protein